MKKIVIAAMALLLIVGLGGCKKKEVNYDYKFTDFIELEVLGSNGYGIARIKEKDFDLNDCKSESNFITIKRNISSLVSNVSLSQNQNLKNGDVVTLSYPKGYIFDQTISMDTSDTKITIANLPEPVYISVLDSKDIVFYGFEGSSNIQYYYPSTTRFNEEQQEGLIYDITIDDETVVENKTVMTVNTTLSMELTEQDPLYTNAGAYLMLNGFLPTIDGEMIVKKVAKKDSLTKLDKDTLEKSLTSALNQRLEGMKIENLVSIQQMDTEDFRYYVIANVFVEDIQETVCYRFNIKMAYLDGDIRISEWSLNGTAKETDLYKDCTLIHDFKEEEIPEVIETEEITEEVEDEENTEVIEEE